MLTDKFIPQRIFESATYSVFKIEPIEFKEQSEFLKRFM